MMAHRFILTSLYWCVLFICSSLSSSETITDDVGIGLRDHPIRGEKDPIYLDGDGWSVRSEDGAISIEAKIPGDLLTDLERANVIPDPLFEMNFLENSAWEGRRWIYSTTFETPTSVEEDKGEIWIVFDGIKMGATIAVNGKTLGNATDQFLRYVFPLSEDDLTNRDDGRPNNLTVTFDETVRCDGRWMACTGGWDWAVRSRVFRTTISLSLSVCART